MILFDPFAKSQSGRRSGLYQLQPILIVDRWGGRRRELQGLSHSGKASPNKINGKGAGNLQLQAYICKG
jgi:hypothetical protein